MCTVKQCGKHRALSVEVVMYHVVGAVGSLCQMNTSLFC